MTRERKIRKSVEREGERWGVRGNRVSVSGEREEKEKQCLDGKGEKRSREKALHKYVRR